MQVIPDECYQRFDGHVSVQRNFHAVLVDGLCCVFFRRGVDSQ